MKLGLVTYNVARDWDLPTLLRICKAAGIAGIEPRTTHAHGIEPELSPAARADVRQRIADSGVALWGLGTVCEFQSTDPAVVASNVDSCRRWCELAHDLGAHGVKVRPNGLPAESAVEGTLHRIGDALRRCGEAADAAGVEIFVEVHGQGTAHPPHIKAILDHCAHPNVGACWNSNPQDIVDGSVRAYFELLRPYLRSCHINDLWSSYPYRELFHLMQQTGYDRYTLCEVGAPIAASDGAPFLSCYRGLWQELQRG